VSSYNNNGVYYCCTSQYASGSKLWYGINAFQFSQLDCPLGTTGNYYGGVPQTCNPSVGCFTAGYTCQLSSTGIYYCCTPQYS
jgi:hypothetical protein